MILGICDDDKSWRDHARKILSDFAVASQIDMEIKTFADSQELFAYTGKPLDGLFLDIELGKENGISVGQKINRHLENCKIIYTTNYIYYSTEVYDTEHIWFVLKPQFEDKIGNIIHRLLYETEMKANRISVETTKREILSLAPADICYVERERRLTKISTVWGKYYVTNKLEEIEPQLSRVDFSRCHSSILVHFRYVKALKRDVYILENGENVQISRRYAKKTREDFLRWSALNM